MDWVKLSARYYLDPAVSNLPDADAETMFTRGLAYAGGEETGGFIPEGMLPGLCRRRRYEAHADALVVAGLWLRRRGGFQITRWEEWQEELEAIARRRSADRDRKRKERAGKAQVNGMSRDMSADCPPPREREKRDNPPLRPPGVAPPRPKRGTRLPDDFRVTAEMVTWAREKTPQVDGRAETEKFRDYWRAKSGSGAAKADWPATWRNWMRRAAEDLGRRSNGSSPRRSTTDERMAQAQALKDQFRDTGQKELT